MKFSFSVEERRPRGEWRVEMRKPRRGKAHHSPSLDGLIAGRFRTL
jgi:hypothetical protein